MSIRQYQTVDGVPVSVDTGKQYRLVDYRSGDVSFPQLRVDVLMQFFTDPQFKGQTAQYAKSVIGQLETHVRGGRNLFIATLSTPLLAPVDGSRPDPQHLGQMYDELQNTYELLKQIAGG